MPTQVDEQLAQRAQRGDRAAFGDLFDRHHQSLLNYVFHMVEDRQQAEDIGHKAFLRAFERLGQLGPPWDFKSWLYRIATNLAVDWLRRRNRWVDETEGAAVVNTVLCKGCGVCTASCRMNAADLSGFNNEEVLAQIGTLF